MPQQLTVKPPLAFLKYPSRTAAFPVLALLKNHLFKSKKGEEEEDKEEEKEEHIIS